MRKNVKIVYIFLIGGIIMIIQFNEPYNDLPFLPPMAELETKEILKQLVKSHKALGELRGYSELIPNKEILINSIVLKEAKISSEIENIVTTHDSIYKAIVSKDIIIDQDTKEVLNYRSAIWKGIDLIKRNNFLTTNIIVEIQKELEKNDAGIRKLPGTSLINDKTGEIIYTPPSGEKIILELMKNLEEYVNNDIDLDDLIKMAVIHYQFESIHPFYDGNGRTGRIINILYLVLKGLLDSPILYLSDYIISNKSEYYKLLQDIKEKRTWESWIIFILKGIEITSNKTLNLIKKIRNLFEMTVEEIKEKAPKIYSKELVEVLFFHPYTKIQFLVEEGICARKTASMYLKELEEIGILQGIRIGRESIYINKELFELLKKN